MLWTACPVVYPNQRRKLQTEYEAYKKADAARGRTASLLLLRMVDELFALFFFACLELTTNAIAARQDGD